MHFLRVMKPMVFICVALVGCSTPRSSGPTAVEDREAAAAHEAQAERERAEYDPSQTQEPKHSPRTGEMIYLATAPYNPTAEHLLAADREMREAGAELRAAHKLEAFEDARCKDIPSAERSACPLLASAVSQVSETSNGIVLLFKPEIDAEDTHRRLECHLAYAEAQGFERPSCPLFVRGMSMKLHSGTHHALEMNADSPAHIADLKAQARRIFLGVQPQSRRETVTGPYAHR